MKSRSAIAFIAAAVLVLSAVTTSKAGPLRLFTSGGAESAFFGDPTFSQSDLDLRRPAMLLDHNRGQLTVTREFESIVNQTRQDKLLYLGTSKEKKIEFFYPLNRNPKYRSAYAGDRYGSNLKFLTDSKIEGTGIYSRGVGSSNAFAQQIGRFRAGYFVNVSRDTAEGHSEEISDKIEYLDESTLIPALLKAREEGFQITGDISKRLTAGFTKSDLDVSARLNFTDADDDYEIPCNLTGERRELSLDFKASPRYKASAYYTHSSIGSLDSITYNSVLEIGRLLSFAEYDLKGLYLRKTPSARHEWMLGYEDYDGCFRLAGTIDIFGTQADLIAGYFLYHAHGQFSRRTLKYAVKWEKGNYTYRFKYAYSKGDAILHYDIGRREFLVMEVQSNETKKYNFAQHQLGLGFERPVSKDAILQYSLIQVVPVLEEIKPDTPKTGGVKKKTRGGTLHIVSVKYLL
jgi:hypothetical protein